MSIAVAQHAEKSIPPMRIALAANGRTDVTLSVRETTWDQLCARLSTPKVGQKDGSYYVRGGELIEMKRADENLKSADVAIIDGDSSFDPETGEIIDGAPPLEKVVAVLEEEGFAFFAHTTHSFRQSDEGRWIWKYRVIIPAHMKSPAELDAVVTYVIDKLHQRGICITDVPENRRWSQPWYMPRVGTKDDLAFFRSHRFDGSPLDVAGAVAWHSALLAREAAERSLPTTPPASVQAAIDGPGGTTTTIENINAFNDEHGLSWVRGMLEKHGYRFVYLDKRGPGGEAYRYIRPGSTSGTAGVVVFRGSRGHWCVFSHHGIEDPLSGRVVDPFDLVATLEHNGDRKAATKSVLPKQQREPSIAEQIQARAQSAPQPIESTPDAEPKSYPQKIEDPKKRKIELVMAGDLVDEPITWLIDQLVPAKGFVALYGKPGSYKSFVALYLAGMISTGREAFGRPTIGGDVVYIAGEGGAGLKRRWDALKIHHDLPGDASIAFLRAQLNLRSTLEDLEALVAAVQQKSLTPQLVIIDTLARAFAGGNENAPEDMGAFIAIVGQLQERLSTAVLVVHHSGKDEARGMRGHSSILGAVDAELEVVKVSADESPDRVGKLTVTKQKDGEDGYEIGYQMISVAVSPIDFEKTSLVVEPMDHAQEQQRKADPNRLPPGQKIVFDALQTAIDEAGETVGLDRIPRGKRCVKVSLWREYFYGMSPQNAETKKKAFKRAADAMVARGTCGIWAEWCWISKD